MNKLPSSFTSLYRLFLRASSASVLYHNGARNHLRGLIRPVFDVAARVIKELQRDQFSPSERLAHEHFLLTFQCRMDATLNLLVNSGQYRGVPHRTIYNLNQLRNAHAVWVHGRYYSGPKNAWNPRAAATANPTARNPPRPHDIDRMERNRVHEHCWDAFGEAVRVAEGRHNLILGRVRLKPWSVKKRR